MQALPIPFPTTLLSMVCVSPWADDSIDNMADQFEIIALKICLL